MIRIYLTGPLAIETPGAVLHETSFRGRQARLLFAYLVLQRTRPAARDELVDLLWPDDPPPAWDSALSALLSRLRSLLESEAMGDSGLSLASPGRQAQLRLPAHAFVDVETAIQQLDLAEGALRAGKPRDAFGPSGVAACIFRRPFLPDVEGPWAEAQRDRLARALLRSLDALAQVYLANAEPAIAVELMSEAVGLDSFREASYRLLMQAHLAAGNRPQALQVYLGLQRHLQRELSTTPTPETQALYQTVAR